MEKISIDEFKKGEIMIGKVVSVELIEGSEKLLKLGVDFAEERPRTVVSGIRKYFEDQPRVDGATRVEAGPHPLIGTKCAFATNLEPRPLMGLTSEAMILAASTDDGKFSPLKVSDDIPEGTKIK